MVTFLANELHHVESVHSTAADKAQRAIDKEIAAHEAAIRDLKQKRNAHSSISRLPPEIMAAIFVSLKITVDWAALGVCRHWRDILLSSPRIWSSIGVHSAKWTSELLRRSKSAPLQVNYAPVYYTEQHLRVAETIMAELGRIQHLNLALHASFIVDLLSRNGGASAPMLEHLRLGIAGVMESPTLPAVVLRDMPSLRYLELTHIGLSSAKLPPLPRLTHLKLGYTTIHTSQLLRLFQHTSNLEEVEITGLVMDSHMDLLGTPVRLPNLTRISISSSEKLEVATIFANIEYPPTTRVTFNHGHSYTEEPNLSGLLKLCRRFAEIDPLVIDEVILDGLVGYLEMVVKTRYHQPYHLSLFLGIDQSHRSTCLTLCSAISPENVSVLKIGGFYGMSLTAWTCLYRQFTQVHSLYLKNAPTESIRSLLRSSSTESPLPALQTLDMTECDFTSEDAELIRDLKCLLMERKSLGTPIRRTTISESSIDVEDLSREEVDQ
ncbi:hypothetical protein EYR36_004907 [Pleurotus pulmonarius]|nr:hypothetical protein EYR36_004907 [Pleurotus pulmonarius]